MSDAQHEHARPDLADMRAALATARAILADPDPDADPDAAHDYAGAGSCDSCTAIAGIQFGFTLAAVFTGKPFVDEPLRLQLLAAVDAARRELDTAPN